MNVQGSTSKSWWKLLSGLWFDFHLGIGHTAEVMSLLTLEVIFISSRKVLAGPGQVLLFSVAFSTRGERLLPWERARLFGSSPIL